VGLIAIERIRLYVCYISLNLATVRVVADCFDSAYLVDAEADHTVRRVGLDMGGFMFTQISAVNGGTKITV